jgi:hypothetical protein
MLYRLDKFSQGIQSLIDQSAENPDAELEFRFGTIQNGHFKSVVQNGPQLKKILEIDGYSFTESKYTNILFDGGIRMRDGNTEKKTTIDTLDMPYTPIAIRLNLASEIEISNPPNNLIPKSTREIERWSTRLKEFPNAILMISCVNYSDWEVELEFESTPKKVNDVIRPLELLLKKMLPNRINILDTDDIHSVTSKYNDTWDSYPTVGFLRKITNKPLNFTREDISLIKKVPYAVSHKLDGEKYTLMFNDNNAYIVSEVDAMWIAESDVAKKYENATFDCEWDAIEKCIYVYDWQTNEYQNYKQRRDFCNAMCKEIKCSSIVLKGAELCKPSAIANCTAKIVEWMKKEYGEEWCDRNDGIIFTPINEPYRSFKEREHRILKYKFPDKISVDVKLQQVRSSPGEKSFICSAAGSHHDVEVKSIKLTVFRNDPLYEEVKSGVIAELVLQDGVFKVMRIRLDKTEPNFISVVIDTLKDMRNPLAFDELLKLLRTNGGINDKGLIPKVTEEHFSVAKKYIQQDRDHFAPIYKKILDFAKSRNLKMSNPECFVQSMTPNVIILYSNNPLRESNDLANELYKVNPTVFLKTVIPYAEFDISILNRLVTKLIAYPEVKFVKTGQIFKSVPVSILGMEMQNIDPKIELIEIYHKLYMPFPEKWPDVQKLEEAVTNQLQKVEGGKRDIDERNEFARKVRTALYNTMEYNDFSSILVGHWGFYELFPDSDPHNEKIQLLTSLEPEDMLSRVESVLRDTTPLKLHYRTEEVFIPYDPHLRRTTYYFEFKGARMPLLDTFNSLSYEIVPWIVGDKKIKVGNPYVLNRFFLIDRWILNVLRHGGFITSEVYENKKNILLSKIHKLRSKKDMTGGTDYDGTYKDFTIERRRLLKQEEKFRPYKPLEYMQKFKSLRTI